MIPRHLSLVPVNAFQAAALQAIIDVEEGRQRRGQYPYAVALLRQLRGETSGRITARDVKRAALNYRPEDRQGEPKERYLAALNRLIESRGQVCPLPLSGCAVGQYFPDTEHRQRDRQYKQLDASVDRTEKRTERAQTQRRRRYQVAVAQAGIELAFVTPSALWAWYKSQERAGIDDDDLVDMVLVWGQRFAGLNVGAFNSGQPLWALLSDMQHELTARSAYECWLDELLLTNKLTDCRG
jgi:hypothetical protein